MDCQHPTPLPIVQTPPSGSLSLTRKLCADDTLKPGSGQWPYYPGRGNIVNMSWTKDMASCPQWAPPGNDPAVMQFCGFEGRVMNLLCASAICLRVRQPFVVSLKPCRSARRHSPRVTIHRDRWPQLAPALWLGGCAANGSQPTQQGWTQASLRSFLAFLDARRINRIGIWCMDPPNKHGIMEGGAMPVRPCCRQWLGLR